MENTLSEFEQLLRTVRETQTSAKTKPYTAMEHFGVSRRGWRVAEEIHKLLESYEVVSEPFIGNCWVYAEVTIKPKPKVGMGKIAGDAKDYDPTPRLNMLTASNIVQLKNEGKGVGLITVAPDTKLTEAITLMLYHDFSQLPILSGSRDVKGMISWKSIGQAMAFGNKRETVSDCKVTAVVMNYDEPLFKAVKTILEKEVVLVKQKDNTISGIITATDIGQQFISMAEPFLIIEQIENHLRKLLDGKFTVEELKKFVDPNDSERTIESLADLTFGEYINIIENQDCFEKLKLQVDRSVICKQLNEVRKIRNDVMHFDPEGVSDQDLELLRKTAEFFQSLSTLIK